ncbi:peptidase associated/transthyretin-like domain-containing protein [Mucilaginibacter mallensis]|nr:hypothetical protein [Mucilaginibacter mallensis]
MKKIFSILLLVVSIAQFATAQTITVTGTVKNNLGDILHYAFVQDKQLKYATYTDSLGNFSVSAGPQSKLAISCYGYKDTLVNVDNSAHFDIVLYPKSGEAIASTPTVAAGGTEMSKRASLEEAFSPSTNNANGAGYNLTAGATFPSFSHKDATEGSRYLLSAWSHGYVVNAQDSIIQNHTFYFNYDKMGGGLLLSQDKKSAIEVDKGLVKSFTLVDGANVSYTFERMPDVDPTHYVQILSTGKKYKIFRTVKTKFVKADYTTNGIASTGNNYDSYQDSYEYYVLDLHNNSRQKLDLKKKSIKADFAADADKVNKFLTDHSDDTIDETYLASLGSYMNE